MVWKKYILLLCYYCAVVHSKKYHADLECMAFDRQVPAQNMSQSVDFIQLRLKFNNTEIDGQYHYIIPAHNLRRIYNWAIQSENHRSKIVQLVIELSTVARSTYLQKGNKEFEEFFTELNAVRYNVSSGCERTSDMCEDVTKVISDHGWLICELFTMVPFNLVAGPKKLCHDPGAQFHTDFQFIIGGENYSNLKKINGEIERSNIDKAIDLLLQTIKNTKRSCPYDYNEHNWRYIKSKDCYKIDRHHSRRRRYIHKFMDDVTSMKKYAYTTTHGIMGDETDHGEWNLSYQVQFPFSIKGKQYFYGHNTDTGFWFIQELLPGGKMGPETDNGYWYFAYEIQFPFIIEGKQYFLGYKPVTGHWFIQELLPDGKMGSETDNGNWYFSYQLMFPFFIDGKQYFYAHRFWSNSWFIAELLPGGKMGLQTDSGSWEHFYGVQFPFSLKGKQYFYAHHLLYEDWFIQKLLPGGKMGNKTDGGYWSYAFPVQFPFSINGQEFFYRQNWWGNWFIEKLLPNGRMGEETNNGSWTYTYEVSFPFSIHGRQFFYGQNLDHQNWFIQELL